MQGESKKRYHDDYIKSKKSRTSKVTMKASSDDTEDGEKNNNEDDSAYEEWRKKVNPKTEYKDKDFEKYLKSGQFEKTVDKITNMKQDGTEGSDVNGDFGEFEGMGDKSYDDLLNNELVRLKQQQKTDEDSAAFFEAPDGEKIYYN
jgi:hypothetical protein